MKLITLSVFIGYCLVKCFSYYSDVKSEEVDYAKKMLLTWLKSYFAKSVEFLKVPPPICSSVFSSKGT